MSVDLSIDRQRLQRLIVHASLSSIFLVAVYILGAIVDSKSAEDFKGSIQAVFRNDQTIGNTALLSRRMADLEMLGLVSCLTISSSQLGEVYSTKFKNGCEEPSYLAKFKWSEGVLQGISGDQFRFQFKVNSSAAYTVYFTIIVLLGMAAINVGLILYWRNIDTKSREVELLKKFGDLAAQVSHDLRSPLSALNVAIKRIQNIPDTDRTFIEQVSVRIQSVADDLLSSHRDSPMGVRNRSSKVDMNVFLAAIFEEKKLSYGSDGRIHFRLDLPPGHRFVGFVDDKELGRAISNLINNAVEAIQQSGEVTVALRQLGSNTAAIVIYDNGVGIPEEILKQMGTKKVSYGKQSEGRGFGLGFLHSKIALGQMGGALDIQSKVGKGTIVTVQFPLAAIEPR